MLRVAVKSSFYVIKLLTIKHELLNSNRELKPIWLVLKDYIISILIFC